jgi:hypothetical protein
MYQSLAILALCRSLPACQSLAAGHKTSLKLLLHQADAKQHCRAVLVVKFSRKMIKTLPGIISLPFPAAG